MFRFKFFLLLFKLELINFFRQSKYGELGVFSSLLFVNVVSSSFLYFSGEALRVSISLFKVPEDIIYNLVLVYLNSSLIVTLVFGVLESIAVFSREADSGFLFSIPVQPDEIVLSKTFWVFSSLLMYMFIPPLFLFYHFREFLSVNQLILILFVNCLVVLIGSIISTFICFLLFRFFSPSKLKGKLATFFGSVVLIGLLAVNLYLASFPSNPQFFYKVLMFKGGNLYWYVSPASWGFFLVKGTVANPYLKPLSLLLLFGSIPLMTLTLKIASRRYYFETVNSFAGYSLLRSRVRGVKQSFGFMKKILGEKPYQFFLNELRLTLRESFRVLNMLIFLLLIAPVFAPFYKGTFLSVQRNAFSFLSILINIFPFYIGAFSAQSIGWEGKNFQIIRNSPVDGEDVVKGKIAFYLSLNFLSMYLFYAVSIFLFKLELLQEIVLFLTSTLGSIGVISFSMFIGAFFANFEGETTGLFGSRKEGINLFGSILYTAVTMISFFGPVLILSVYSLNHVVPEQFFILPGLGIFSLTPLSITLCLSKISFLEV